MRHSVSGPNSLEKPELIPLLSFQRQIPASAHETGLSSHPNITHLSPPSPSPSPSFSLSPSLHIYTVSPFLHTAAQHLLHAASWQEKVIITTHKSYPDPCMGLSQSVPG